jgi:hypothetical protein
LFDHPEGKVTCMNDRRKPPAPGAQAVTGAKDERVRQPKRSASGVHGPIEADRTDYKTHYGETSYGAGQTRHVGQSPIDDVRQGDDGRVEGKAGSKATVPGPGADRGPPG